METIRSTFGGEPLVDDGVKLATLDRGLNRELRVRWKTYKGHPFLDLREWSVNRHNSQWFPEKAKTKGISIKPRELAAVIAALQAALSLGSSHDV